jgi:hypothetical protein
MYGLLLMARQHIGFDSGGILFRYDIHTLCHLYNKEARIRISEFFAHDNGYMHWGNSLYLLCKDWIAMGLFETFQLLSVEE